LSSFNIQYLGIVKQNQILTRFVDHDVLGGLAFQPSLVYDAFQGQGHEIEEIRIIGGAAPVEVTTKGSVTQILKLLWPGIDIDREVESDKMVN